MEENGVPTQRGALAVRNGTRKRVDKTMPTVSASPQRFHYGLQAMDAFECVRLALLGRVEIHGCVPAGDRIALRTVQVLCRVADRNALR